MTNLLRSFPLAITLLLAPLIRLVEAQQLAPSATPMKNKILKRMNTNVTVVLRNGAEVKGRITQASENMFTIKEDRTRHQRDVYFTDVMRLKSGGMSKGAKFGILTGLITGSVLIGALMSLKGEPAGAR